MHERQRHEFGESACAVLNSGEHTQVCHPVLRGVDVPVHHGRAGAQPYLVRGTDDIDPLGRGQLALGEHPADLVIENLRRSTRNGVQARRTQFGQPIAHTLAALGGTVDDFHGAEGVHMHAGHPLLHRTHQIRIPGHGQFRVDAALHADLGGPGDIRLPGAVAHLLRGQ
ncbi:Uncharacterised protein [Mycobacteroides abscessus subsp. massiliense]|nr:Uncharacterised protein [Mycobacteroides abscessus subsp. massiliense]